MSPRARSALLWGAVGSLAFLVLARASRLVAGPSPGVPVPGGGAVAVGGVVAVASYVVEPRLARRGRNEQS